MKRKISKYITKVKKNINRKANLAEQNKKEPILKTKPFGYVLGITNACNLNCPLCITGLREQKKAIKHMDFDLFQEIINKIKNYAIWVQLYNWGEPLLHPKLVDMVALCTKHNISTQISSNLSLKNVDNILHGLVSNGLRHLIVSFDGLTQKEYSRYRVGGDLNTILNNIVKLKEHKEDMGLKFPIIDLQFLKNRHNEFQIDTLKKEYKKFGADKFTICDMTGIFKDNNVEKYKYWFEEDDIITRKYLDVDQRMLRNVCQFLYNIMIIDQDGSIPPCCFSTDPADDFGGWDSNKTILEMYNSEKFIAARKIFKEHSYDKDVCCSNCSVVLSYNDNIISK
jgi:MoaA/NifB/PqqE/SkfB family radical SAM enzyme